MIIAFLSNLNLFTFKIKHCKKWDFTVPLLLQSFDWVWYREQSCDALIQNEEEEEIFSSKMLYTKKMTKCNF